MDPDKALERLVELSEVIVNGAPEDMAWPELVARAEELAGTFLGLDEWLRKAGFLPAACHRGREGQREVRR